SRRALLAAPRRQRGQLARQLALALGTHAGDVLELGRCGSTHTLLPVENRLARDAEQPADVVRRQSDALARAGEAVRAKPFALDSAGARRRTRSPRTLRRIGRNALQARDLALQ